MNQKIKQLAGIAKNNVPAGLEVDQWVETYNQIFAKLIVKECASIVDTYGRWILYDKLALKIKREFGVEE